MLWTNSFIPTLRQPPQEAESVSHQLMLKAGLLRQLIGGVYSYLPLGFKVLCNIESIIRRNLDSAGCQEVLLPSLQPQELWDKTGRNTLMEQIMFRFTDRRNRKLCLGPTHEEIITDLVSRNVNSYKQLPIILYQIQNKFRDEIRPRFGLVRSCEFIMKDAYSFDRDASGLDKSYNLMFEAYRKIFQQCGLEPISCEAQTGIMGGSESHEFMVKSPYGEDVLFICGSCGFASTVAADTCPKCRNAMFQDRAIEIGHIFKLGTKYSQALSADYLDEKGSRLPCVMGCYGIGVSRLISAVIETNHDDNGIIWPAQISPYNILILPLNISEEACRKAAFDLYHKLTEAGFKALLDDRDERPGVKLNDADLIGIPLRVIIGKKSLQNQELELQYRKDKKVTILKVTEADKAIADIVNYLRGMHN